MSDTETVGAEVGIAYRGNRVFAPHKIWSVLDIGIKSMFSKCSEGFVSDKGGPVGQKRDPSCSTSSFGGDLLERLLKRFEFE